MVDENKDKGYYLDNDKKVIDLDAYVENFIAENQNIELILEADDDDENLPIIFIDLDDLFMDDSELLKNYPIGDAFDGDDQDG